MRGTAIKKRSREKAKGFQEMGTLRCDGCGEEFFIVHDSASMDTKVAEKQAKWLEKSSPMSTSVIRNALTELNSRTSC